MGREDEEKDDSGTIYKTKVVDFLGRQVPIVLQNDNGPCPLLAICNVLLLRNSVSLSTEISEISLSKLLTLIAERCLDANAPGKGDKEYEINQQQNIADAMILLPRLATGIDVNVRFRHIHDFEFTPECAIFDLFDIGLVHGWLCDPQDEETCNVLYANSYNTLVEKLVALHASRSEEVSAGSGALEEPTVDFVAATTAALGVPTPSASQLWSSETSFEDLTNELNQAGSKQAAVDRQRKGDSEEAAELMQALQLSQSEGWNGTGPYSPADCGLSRNNDGDFGSHDLGNGTFTPMSEVSVGSSGNFTTTLEVIDMPEEAAELGAREENSMMHEPGVSSERKSYVPQEGLDTSGGNTGESAASTWLGEESSGFDKSLHSSAAAEERHTAFGESKASSSIFALGDDVDRPVNPLDVSEGDIVGQSEATHERPPVDGNVEGSKDGGKDVLSEMLTDSRVVGVDDSRNQNSGGPSDDAKDTGTLAGDEGKPFLSFGPGSIGSSRSLGSSGLDDEEPLYEGEDDLANQGGSNYGDKEPLYEGEVILAEQASGCELPSDVQLHVREVDSGSQKQIATVSDEEGRTIENFLHGNASQLTIYGLFTLRDGIKDRELCVFFRNNHFSTMFKLNGDLYLLASDQGYLNQPIVWEKLSSVDGDTVFVKGDFNEYRPDEHSNLWNERDAVAATADYISAQDRHSNQDSDLQLALALQQQELEQQQQHQQLQQLQQQQQQQGSSNSTSQAPPSAATTANPRPTSSLGAGRMYTGPAKPSTPKPEPTKSKDKCTIM